MYQRATAAGKRVQALDGAKNFIVVMPDADLDRAIPTIAKSFYGCAGRRCLAGSVLLPVGTARAPAHDLVEARRAPCRWRRSRVGRAIDPVINQHRDRVRDYVKLDWRRRSAGTRQPRASFAIRVSSWARPSSIA
jgi:malonate-semialdehyde dehydrogenase (acetylating)/methylmalonate-semialdehyde dehydrogenase